MNDHKMPKSATGIPGELLSAFARNFGENASHVLDTSGWVVYLIGPELRIKHYLAHDVPPDELAEYERGYARIDPLAPAACLSANQTVVSLKTVLRLQPEKHGAYQSAFMARYGIADALEIIMQSAAGILVGCSQIRHGDRDEFSATDIGIAHSLKQLGNFTLSHLLPQRSLSIETIGERFPQLTHREVVILQLVSVGLTNNQLGNELNISVPTVKSHLLSIFRKLDVQSRTELAAKVLM